MGGSFVPSLASLLPVLTPRALVLNFMHTKFRDCVSVGAAVVDENNVEGGSTFFDKALDHARVLMSNVEEEVSHVLQLSANFLAASDFDAFCACGKRVDALRALGEDVGKVGPNLLHLSLAELCQELVCHAVEKLLHINFVVNKALFDRANAHKGCPAHLLHDQIEAAVVLV